MLLYFIYTCYHLFFSYLSHPFIFIAGSVAIEHLRVIFELFVSLPWTVFDVSSELVWTIFLSCFELVSTCMDHMYVLVWIMCILDLYGSYVCTCMDLYEMQVKLCIYAYVLNCRNVPKSN